jgi:uncharacterized protein (DUF302 family)
MATFVQRKVLKSSYDEALAKIPEALKTEGFGVLTEIDVRETMKKKLDVDFRRYKILGACNPPLAHKALGIELELGVMLPCNLIVYEGDDGKTVVAAIDPMQTMAALGKPELQEVAKEVQQRLGRVLERLV